MNPTRADLIGPLDMFKIGIGPSSSHTVGPMIAALDFRKNVIDQHIKKLGGAAGHRLHVTVELFGSLSATGQGHATDGAVCAGLIGLHPKSAEPDAIWAAMPSLESTGGIETGRVKISFTPSIDILWQGFLMDGNALPHPNTMRFRLYDSDKLISECLILSVGGGFIETTDEAGKRRPPEKEESLATVPHPYNSAAEFVEQCVKTGLSPWQVVIENQESLGMTEAQLRKNLNDVLDTFSKCIMRGLNTEGILPGGLNVKRRAKGLYQQLLEGKMPAWAGSDLRPSVYAMAVNEENAAGGKVVTAPTNGSSGLIPAVWRTIQESNGLSQTELQNGLIVASVIGALVKVHASISGAEVGCQGEVGTSCAMAAAGAVAMLGGSPYQIEQAAEIGIEHHLGMTCDPIKGLVQVPCIERNAMGAVKALNAAALSLASDGHHLISLDRALEVMKQTGLDMNQKYKETATGGLALG
ncbi:MAG: L-serine ammonia-lyase [Candidatus Obscuribacterales bacterium]|nr:L-serine ammonia-lyase [Candidatus Obscuribacterales bacterium]